jgi:hypothetical protein
MPPVNHTPECLQLPLLRQLLLLLLTRLLCMLLQM